MYEVTLTDNFHYHSQFIDAVVSVSEINGSNVQITD